MTIRVIPIGSIHQSRPSPSNGSCDVAHDYSRLIVGSVESTDAELRGGPVRLLVPLDHRQSSLFGPPLDDQLGGVGVESRYGYFGYVGNEQLPLGLTFRRVRLDLADRYGTSGDLRLTRPLVLLAVLGVKGGSMEGEARIPTQIDSLVGAGHRTEAKLSVGELALDARDAWRPVGAQGGDGLVTTGIEELLDPFGELGF